MGPFWVETHQSLVDSPLHKGPAVWSFYFLRCYLLNNQLSYRWFETSQCSGGVIVMTYTAEVCNHNSLFIQSFISKFTKKNPQNGNISIWVLDVYQHWNGNISISTKFSSLSKWQLPLWSEMHIWTKWHFRFSEIKRIYLIKYVYNGPKHFCNFDFCGDIFIWDTTQWLLTYTLTDCSKIYASNHGIIASSIKHYPTKRSKLCFKF